MITRYSRKELTDIWSESNKYQIWLDVEIAAAEGMEKIGTIPKGVASAVRKKAKIINEIIQKIPKSEAGFVEKELLRDIGKVAGRGIRGFSKWFGVPDLIFGTVDYLNERSKGRSKEEARGIALNNTTFGIYNDPKNIAYMKGLQKTAESMGIDSSTFDSVYKLNMLNKS